MVGYAKDVVAVKTGAWLAVVVVGLAPGHKDVRYVKIGHKLHLFDGYPIGFAVVDGVLAQLILMACYDELGGEAFDGPLELIHPAVWHEDIDIVFLMHKIHPTEAVLTSPLVACLCNGAFAVELHHVDVVIDIALVSGKDMEGKVEVAEDYVCFLVFGKRLYEGVDTYPEVFWRYDPFSACGKGLCYIEIGMVGMEVGDEQGIAFGGDGVDDGVGNERLGVGSARDMVDGDSGFR